MQIPPLIQLNRNEELQFFITVVTVTHAFCKNTSSKIFESINRHLFGIFNLQD